MNDKSVVVTGAGLGIGRATASRLQSLGWSVVAVDTNREALESLKLERQGITPLVGDVTEPETFDAAGYQAEALGQLAGWVNNAAIPQRGRLDAINREVIDRTIAVNLTSVILGCQWAVKSFLRHSTPGIIVNISSIHAQVGFPNTPVYDACKGGVEALTRHLCVEYGHLRIRCNSVSPGAVMTDHPRRLIEQAGEQGFKVVDEMRALSPMSDIAEASDIADAVAYLFSEGARFVNGTSLTVDGGATARCYGFPPQEDLLPSTPAKIQSPNNRSRAHE